MKILKIIFYLLVFIGIVMMLRLSVPYTKMLPGIDFLKTKNSVYAIAHWRLSFYVHVFTSSFVLMAGLVQFTPIIFQRYRKAHKIAGYIYCTGILAISGPASLIMAFYANGGVRARISFVLLAALWIFSTAKALLYARKRKWIWHGQWMARSYALTLSALTLRSYALLIGLMNFDIGPTNEYVLISWLSWTVNLLVAEVWIRKGGVNRFMAYSQA